MTQALFIKNKFLFAVTIFASTFIIGYLATYLLSGSTFTLISITAFSAFATIACYLSVANKVEESKHKGN